MYESACSPLFTNGKLSLKRTMDVSTPCSIMIELFYFFKHRQHQQWTSLDMPVLPHTPHFVLQQIMTKHLLLRSVVFSNKGTTDWTEKRQQQQQQQQKKDGSGTRVRRVHHFGLSCTAHPKDVIWCEGLHFQHFNCEGREKGQRSKQSSSCINSVWE